MSLLGDVRRLIDQAKEFPHANPRQINLQEPKLRCILFQARKDPRLLVSEEGLLSILKIVARK